VAVTEALWSEVILPLVAVKLAEVEPAPMLTEAGIVKEGLLADSPTTTLPEGTAADNVTVHVELEPGARVTGEHCRPEMPNVGVRTVIVPPLPVIASAVPSGREATGPFREIATVEPPTAEPSPTVTVATVPELIEVAFMPLAIHVKVPVPAEQVTFFPAPVNGAPAATVMDATLPGV
jgi:hypothetical protein